MAEEVANVARRVNATVEEGKDTLGKNLVKNLYFPDSTLSRRNVALYKLIALIY